MSAFCTLAVIVMINGQPVKTETPWHGGTRTQADGGLTKTHCDEYIKEYNLSHEYKLVCVCGK